MKRVLITGVAGFVGFSLARRIAEGADGGCEIVGMDNFSRPGSERNRALLAGPGVRLIHGDTRRRSDFDTVPPVDWVIDAAAEPSVLAGVSDGGASRRLAETNLWGSVETLEYCRRTGAGLILLSSSRVYSLRALGAIPVRKSGGAFAPEPGAALPDGAGPAGIREDFSTDPPLSLYGATKRASEVMALEYGETFGFPVWIDRCGVLAGAGQFGKPDQGIVSFWIHSWKEGRPLRYIGFDGSGAQVRDVLHPADLASLLVRQMDATSRPDGRRVWNVSGGVASAFSLRQLSEWCAARFGPTTVGVDPDPRPFDVPWLVLDADRAETDWAWRPERGREEIFAEVARHAEEHPDWLALSGVRSEKEAGS